MGKVVAVTYQISRVQISVQISEKISPAGGREQLVQIYFYYGVSKRDVRYHGVSTKRRRKPPASCMPNKNELSAQDCRQCVGTGAELRETPTYQTLILCHKSKT